MDSFIRLIESEGFIAFIATYGLATIIVIFIIFFRDPKRYNFLSTQYKQLHKDYQELAKSYEQLVNTYKVMREDIEKTYKDEYNKLENSYNELNNTFLKLEKDYQQLETDIHPQTRRLSEEQARHLAYIGLDRDLYKLYYLMCEKIDHNTKEDIANFVAQSIRFTNETWDNFISPFPKVKHIGSLYEIYRNQGDALKEKLEEIFNQETESVDDKKNYLWNILLKNTIEMKNEFDELLKTYKESAEVLVYQEEEN